MHNATGGLNPIPYIPFFSVATGYPESAQVLPAFNARQDRYQEIIDYDKEFNGVSYTWKYGDNMPFQHSTDSYLQLIGNIEMVKERQNANMEIHMSNMPNFDVPLMLYMALLCTVDYSKVLYDKYFSYLIDDTYSSSALEVAAQFVSATKGYYEIKDTISTMYASYTEMLNDYLQTDTISEQFFRIGEQYALQRRSYSDDATKILFDEAFGNGGGIDMYTALENKLITVAPSQGDYVYMLLGR